MTNFQNSAKAALVQQYPNVIVSNPQHELRGLAGQVVGITSDPIPQVKTVLMGKPCWLKLADVMPADVPLPVLMTHVLPLNTGSFEEWLATVKAKTDAVLLKKASLFARLKALSGRDWRSLVNGALVVGAVLGIILIGAALSMAYSDTSEATRRASAGDWMRTTLYAVLLTGGFVFMAGLYKTMRYSPEQKRLWLSEVRDFLPQVNEKQGWSQGQHNAVVEQLRRLWPDFKATYGSK